MVYRAYLFISCISYSRYYGIDALYNFILGRAAIGDFARVNDGRRSSAVFAKVSLVAFETLDGAAVAVRTDNIVRRAECLSAQWLNCLGFTRSINLCSVNNTVGAELVSEHAFLCDVWAAGCVSL